MVTADIIPALPEHIPVIAADVRPQDAAEFWAVAYSTPERAMQQGVDYSDRVYTGRINGQPVCMFGVHCDSLLERLGTPWMIGSRLLEQHAITFLRHCRAEVQKMLSGYDMLENYVDARNAPAVKWIRWLGFTLEEAKPYGVLGVPFHRFFMKGKEDV
nr:hypothetical protein 5 [bacterium]